LTRTPEQHAGSRGTIAIVRHSYYPFELNVKREAEALLESGFGVHVICLRNAGEMPRETVEGVHVHRLPVGHRRGRILRYLWEYNAFFVLASAKLARLHRRLRLAAVQVNTMPDYLVFAALYPKLTGAKVVLHLHEPVPELFQTMFPDRWYTRLFVRLAARVEQASIRFADRALTVTDQMRDNFVRRGADADKITVVVNVPDDRLFRLERYEHLRKKVAAEKAEERAHGVFRVFTHGAIEERYGFDTLVRAVARARGDVPGVHFRFTGAGDYLRDVKRIAETVNASDRVTHVGFLPFEQMVEEILLADVCIVAPKKNPYSVLVHTNKMYEYVALRRPVIASRLDSVAAYFPENALFYFEAGSSEDLAQKLRHAFLHPEEMSRRVERATEIYERYRWETERRHYLGVYDAVSQGATR
jgi:glycosyltransferase involved in cell wall biosynthesis